MDLSSSTDVSPAITSIANVYSRPEVGGKFLRIADQKIYVKGVTYGTFRSGRDGSEYPDARVVRQDFERIAAGGMNAIRTYTVPPVWLLDLAKEHGLLVMVGVPWEQHVTFLDDPRRARHIEEKVRTAIRSCAGHPAILCFAIGNEIPAPIVRWHGRARVERFLKRLYLIAKQEDPGSLITYVNYPSTEYLQLPFIDLVCYNVYLESRESLQAYIARLQNIAGDRPLLLAEIGLDSRRNGLETQAHILKWQIETAFSEGCAGTFLFAWTDEWHRGGYEIDDWDFGLTTRMREPKPALAVAHASFSEVPLSLDGEAPKVSVVVCAHNAERTISETLEGLKRLNYSNYEVIVVDDGSTDQTAGIARRYNVRVISTENRGLSSARNTGLEAAAGEIVAYIDADAYPDPDWLTYLASGLLKSKHAGVGGPNILPIRSGEIAESVANAPGGPVHVLLSDQEAEHIPGCNMAFRKSSLQKIGGFDPQFRVAGDDVDVCWRLQRQGWTLGYIPGAMVWHHRRNSVREYWRQQKGYGRAEGMLEKKWPEKYNRLGHLTWKGRLYGNGITKLFRFKRSRIYHGIWGTGLFQSLYTPRSGRMLSLPLMPEWFYVIGSLTAASALALLWKPLVWALPLLLLAISAQMAPAIIGGAAARFSARDRSRIRELRMRLTTTLLYLIQPLARLLGRMEYGLTPWRGLSDFGFVFPRVRTVAVWRERWQSAQETIKDVQTKLRASGAMVFQGGEFDEWDFQVRTGSTGDVHVQMAIEEHGAGKQLVRFRIWPVPSINRLGITLFLDLMAIAALLDGAWIASVIIGLTGVLLGSMAFRDCGSATAAVLHAIDELKKAETLS